MIGLLLQLWPLDVNVIGMRKAGVNGSRNQVWASECYRSNAFHGHQAAIQLDFERFKTTKVNSLSANVMNTEPWVTAEQVALHLGVVKDTVYRWRERKGLPAHKIGRLWKFQLSEVDDWVRIGGADETPNR